MHSTFKHAHHWNLLSVSICQPTSSSHAPVNGDGLEEWQQNGLANVHGRSGLYKQLFSEAWLMEASSAWRCFDQIVLNEHGSMQNILPPPPPHEARGLRFERHFSRHSGQ